MKRIFLLIIFLFGGVIFPSAFSVANGIVPCGNPGQPECTLCALFQMIDNLFDFVLFKLIPPVALLILIIGFFIYILSSGDPDRISLANKLFTSVAIGILITYGAFLLLGLFFHAIGLADWTTNIYQSWWKNGFFQINCR